MRFIDPEVLPHFELPCKPHRERRTRGTVTDDTEQLTVRSAHVTTRVQQPASLANNDSLVRFLQVIRQILNCGSPSSIHISTIFQADISDILRTSPPYRGHTPRSCGRRLWTAYAEAICDGRTLSLSGRWLSYRTGNCRCMEDDAVTTAFDGEVHCVPKCPISRERRRHRLLRDSP